MKFLDSALFRPATGRIAPAISQNRFERSGLAKASEFLSPPAPRGPRLGRTTFEREAECPKHVPSRKRLAGRPPPAFFFACSRRAVLTLCFIAFSSREPVSTSPGAARGLETRAATGDISAAALARAVVDRVQAADPSRRRANTTGEKKRV